MQAIVIGALRVIEKWLDFLSTPEGQLHAAAHREFLGRLQERYEKLQDRLHIEELK